MNTTLTPDQHAVIGLLAYEYLAYAPDDGRSVLLLALQALDGRSDGDLLPAGRDLLANLVTLEFRNVRTGWISCGDPDQDRDYAGRLAELLETLQVAEVQA